MDKATCVVTVVRLVRGQRESNQMWAWLVMEQELAGLASELCEGKRGAPEKVSVLSQNSGCRRRMC